MRRLLTLLFFAGLWLMAIAQQKEHIVKRGETLASVAQTYGLTEAELKAANPNLTVCFAGVKLKIPNKSTATPQIPAKDEPTVEEKLKAEEVITLVEESSVLSGEEAYEKGEEYFRQENYDKAFEWYMKSAEKGYVSAIHDVGYMYAEGKGVAQDYSKAMEWYRKAADQGNALAQSNIALLYKNGSGVTMNYAKALKWFQMAAKQDDLTALRNLGYMYEHGEGVATNYMKAIEWYEKGASLGDAISQYNLGVMYYNGMGVKTDYIKAFEWYLKAANNGDEDAQNNIATMYFNGVGVEQNYLKAFNWYMKAADRGHSDSQNSVGFMYSNGVGVEKNSLKAFDWYQKAANQGNALAQFNLGNMYDNGEGVAQDYSKAMEWYEKSANQGYAGAQYNLGLMYYNGIGLEIDYAKAFNWYMKAASQEMPEAQYNLGYMYYNGIGLEKDYDKAFKWYMKAADSGFPDAQNNVGFMYEEGLSVTKDIAKAAEWYQKAASQGNALAQCNLAYLYEIGKGVKKDYAKAIEWYEKAAEQGHERAKSNLATLREIVESGGNATKQETTPQPTKQASQNLIAREELDLVDSDIPEGNRVSKNTFAIIIANEDYQEEVKVDYARNDGEVFKNYCHKTLGLPEKNIHYAANATLAKLFGELDWLRQVCEAYKGEANVVFYYAGHGIPDEMSGSAYLLPIDGNSRLIRTCFSMVELYDILGSLPCKKVTVLMDACFSGAKRSGGMMTSARGVAIKAKVGLPKGKMIVLSAAQGDETAYKFEEAKHGLFTYFLLKKLKASKGNVTLGELSRYLQEEVGRFSIVENGKSQTPSIQTSDKISATWQSMNIN